MKNEMPPQSDNYRKELAGRLRELRAEEKKPIKEFFGMDNGKDKAEKLISDERETAEYKEAAEQLKNVRESIRQANSEEKRKEWEGIVQELSDDNDKPFPPIDFSKYSQEDLVYMRDYALKNYKSKLVYNEDGSARKDIAGLYKEMCRESDKYRSAHNSGAYLNYEEEMIKKPEEYKAWKEWKQWDTLEFKESEKFKEKIKPLVEEIGKRRMLEMEKKSASEKEEKDRELEKYNSLSQKTIRFFKEVRDVFSILFSGPGVKWRLDEKERAVAMMSTFVSPILGLTVTHKLLDEKKAREKRNKNHKS